MCQLLGRTGNFVHGNPETFDPKSKNHYHSIACSLWHPNKSIVTVAHRLVIDVGLTRKRVTRVAFPFKQQFRDQGRLLAEDLSETLRSRKAWLGQLEDRMAFASAGELQAGLPGKRSSVRRCASARERRACKPDFISSWKRLNVPAVRLRSTFWSVDLPILGLTPSPDLPFASKRSAARWDLTRTAAATSARRAFSTQDSQLGRV